MEVVGTPSPEVLAKISSEHVSHQPPRPLLTQPLVLWRKGPVGLDQVPCGERGPQWIRAQGRCLAPSGGSR